MSNEIILTEKEITAIQQFHNKTKKTKQHKNGLVDNFHNVVIKQEPCGGIGALLYIQTQDDFMDKSDNWEDITDYEAW